MDGGGEMVGGMVKTLPEQRKLENAEENGGYMKNVKLDKGVVGLRPNKGNKAKFRVLNEHIANLHNRLSTLEVIVSSYIELKKDQKKFRKFLDKKAEDAKAKREKDEDNTTVWVFYISTGVNYIISIYYMGNLEK